MSLVYCDFIADFIKKTLPSAKMYGEDFTSDVGPVKLDLNVDGVFLSTKKTLDLVDNNGTKYRITVEEMPDE
jgi:hypothetical protein